MANSLYKMIQPSLLKFRGEKGQVMVEAMVALGALTLGYLAVLTLLNQSLGLSTTVSDRNIATYLAAEGIEIVRNLNDANVRIGTAAGGGFGVGFLTGNYEVTPMTVLEINESAANPDIDSDPHNPGLRIPSGAPPPPANPGMGSLEPFQFVQTASAAFPPPVPPNATRYLRYHPDDGYNYNTGVQTRFRRVVIINKFNGTNYIKVRSVVTWAGKGGLTDSVVMSDYFFNWR